MRPGYRKKDHLDESRCQTCMHCSLRVNDEERERIKYVCLLDDGKRTARDGWCRKYKAKPTRKPSTSESNKSRRQIMSATVSLSPKDENSYSVCAVDNEGCIWIFDSESESWMRLPGIPFADKK